jgi:phage FluMu gp28-like protein
MMDQEQLEDFARQLDADADAIMERWEGRPDLIIEDIFRVRDIDTGQARDLELFDVQRKLIHAYFYSDAGRITAYKGRRIGYSFAVVVSYLLEAMFYPKSYYPIVSNSKEQSKARISDIKSLIDDAKINIPTNKTNTDYIELWNGSSFEAYSSESNTSRGKDSARSVLMDEMAFIEDEEGTQQALGAFLSLGENRKMMEVSTPNTKNDLFMRHFREGTRDGSNGMLAIKQPTFHNADDIDIYTPLPEQELEPVRPEINIDQLESERMSDPEGFGQEYLCRPVADSYNFFNEDIVLTAQSRGASDGYETGLMAPKHDDAKRVMGVDIGINRDDTVLSITDHQQEQRNQREVIVVDDDILLQAGVTDPDRGNANHIATLIEWVRNQMGVDLVIMDRGGVGQTFDRIVEQKLGGAFRGFDFSASKKVEKMMGDMNIGLREQYVGLLDRDRVRDELTAIVKEKSEKSGVAHFSGKDNSESGKDDVAMATVLSMYPPTETGASDLAAKSRKHVPENKASVSQNRQGLETDHRTSVSASKISRTSRSRSNEYRARNRRR